MGKRNAMHVGGLGVVAALLLATPIAAQAQDKGQARDKLRYGQIAGSVKSVSSLALYTAQRKGFLARANIDLEVVRLPGVHHMIEGLDKNIVDVSHTATPYLVEGVLKGSGTVGVVGGPANTIFSVIAKPGIKSFADLKGKMFAMSLPVDTISIASRLLLQKHGLKDTDYRTTELIGTQTRAKCLIDGDCDAVPLGQPDDIVFMAKGYTKLGDSLEGHPGAAIQRDRGAPRLGGARTRIWWCASPAHSATPIASCAIRTTATRSSRSWPRPPARRRRSRGRCFRSTTSPIAA